MSNAVLPRKQFVRTFSHHVYGDAWQCVKDFRLVMEFHRDNPDKSAYLIGKDLELPRGRVRSWITGSIPDPVRALSLAEEKGWLDATWDTAIGRAFNRLVALIFCSGSLGARDFAPIFVVDDENSEAFVRSALEAVACGSRRQHFDDPNRATQLIPREDQRTLGRALYTIGAPRGEKNQVADIKLPAYLETAPDDIRRDFVEVYISIRGSPRSDRTGWSLRESRPDEFSEALANLIESVTGESVSQLADGSGLLLPDGVISALDLRLSPAL